MRLNPAKLIRDLDVQAIAPALEATRRGPLVLLFYDGYERRARAGALGALRSQAHRAARFGWRNMRRRQVRTGFYTAFLSLVSCLRQAGCDVRVNDFAAARARPSYPIGLAGYPSVLEQAQLPNPKIFGPGDFGSPEGSAAVAADPTFRRLIQPCEWFVDLYRPWCGDKMMSWFVGIDLRLWPDQSRHAKTQDFVIYDKIRWRRETQVPAVLDRVGARLDAQGLKHETLQYGAHHLDEFRAAVARSRGLIFLCEHETQGLAYQEAMAAGVPVLAWDEGELVDPFLRPFAPQGFTVSSVPYFDSRCGERFTIGEFETTLERFQARLAAYRPRDYVAEHLSMAEAAERYLRALQAVAAGT